MFVGEDESHSPQMGPIGVFGLIYFGFRVVFVFIALDLKFLVTFCGAECFVSRMGPILPKQDPPTVLIVAGSKRPVFCVGSVWCGLRE